MLKLVGNDLVNLTKERTANKHLNHRFLDKVFATTEKQLIINHHDPSLILWMIWAAKEACFKACQKKKLDLIFSHKNFIIEFLDNPAINQYNFNNINIRIFLKGIAYYNNNRLSIKWQFHKKNIHAIAILLKDAQRNNEIFDDWHQIKSKIFPIDSTNYGIESLTTKLQAINFLKSSVIPSNSCQNLLILRRELLINGIKKQGPPELFIKNGMKLNKVSNLDLSLSHDHGWGAVAFSLNKNININIENN